jgi:hypothetical protein
VDEENLRTPAVVPAAGRLLDRWQGLALAVGRNMPAGGVNLAPAGRRRRFRLAGFEASPRADAGRACRRREAGQ